MDKKFNSDFYKHILDKINSNIFITDTETDEIVYMNDCMKKSFNLQDTEGKTCWEVLSGDATERCNFCKVNKLEKSGQVCFSREKNAVTGRVYMNCDMLESYDGKLYHVRNSADITDSVRLSTEASVDELTGVINRSAGKKRLSEMLSNPDSRKFTVALYDINGLKWVNDTYGHLEGDKLLVFTAQNIQQALDEDDFIFRLSGDEFIVVFCGKDIKQAELRMENMLSILEERKPLSNMNYDVSFSYGLAAINGGEHLTVSDVLSIADTQMYIQKRDRHIMLGQKRLQQSPARIDTPLPFSYNKDYVFEAVSDCTDDYMFIGNIQKKSMICSQKMSVEFNLPTSIEENVIDLISPLIHEDDLQIFLKSIKEITDGGAKLHTATYRAKNAYGKWVNLLCKGKIINDKNGNPELFAGVIRNLDKEYDLYASNMDLEQFISSASCINHGNIENSYSDNTQQAFCFMENTVGNERLKTEVKLLNFVNRNLPGGISAVYDKPDYPIFCINQAILSYTNYTYAEFMEISDGKLIRLIHKDDRENFSAQMQKQLEKDGIYETKCRFIRKDGKPIWVYSRGKYVTDDNGKRLIVSFFIDVTKETEQERELSFIYNSSPDGIFKMGAAKELPLIYGNDGFFRIFGYTKEQYENESNGEIMSLIHADDRAEVAEKIRNIIENNQSHAVFEHRIIKRNGSVAWVHVDVAVSVAPNGTAVIMGMLIDITDRRTLEERLLRTEQLFMTAREHTCLKMWEYDIDNQRIILIDKAENSQGTERYIENVPEGLISMGYVLEESADKYRKLYSDMLAGKDKVSAAIRTLKNNKLCWENITYITRKDAFGNPYWAIGVSEDITAQKEAEARFFKEEAMRSLLSDDFLYSLRLNLSRNSLEEIITYNDKSIRTDLKNVGYDRIFKNICNSVANADDLKRLEANYTTDKIMWYAEHKKNVPDFEYRQKGADGHIFWTMLTFRIAPSPDSGDFILFIHGKNIDMLKKRELALEKKAELDEITGLYNLNTIKPLIESILKNKQDCKGISALMILDADNFKQIQLSGGFLTRNEVLKQIGNDIKRNTPASSISARLTSDLFLIFYHNMTKEDILRCEESVRNAICRKYKVMNFEVELTFFAGVVYNFSEETSYDNLYRQALLALETAKRKGKDCLCCYSNSEHSDSRFELSVYSDKGSDDSILNLSSLLEKSLSLIENGKERKSINRSLLSYAGNLYSADSIVYFKSKNGGLKKEVSWNSNDSANSYEDGNADFIQNVVEEIYPLTEARIFSSECAGWENISKFLGGNKTNIPVIISVVYENSKASECILVINPRRKTDILKPLKFISDFMRHAENTEKLHNSCTYSLNHDNKTHLLNYDSYMNYLKKSNDDVYSAFGMVGIHIVDLKKFNRIYGNEHGDEIIAFASNLLIEIFGKDLCYRTSSAGFLALCPDITIENLREKYALLQQRVSENYGDIIVTAKVWEQNSISVEKIQHQLEEKIDIALKQKKEHSSDYTDSTLSVISKKLKMSINDGGLRTFLQPKATAGTNEICGAEALVRYCTKDNKIIPPSKFLPSIEKAGLIRYVDLFVLEDVCRIIRRWLDLGWTPFTISLNYSRSTILEPGILEETNRIVESYGIRKDLLEIEVTETIGSIDSEGLKDIVSRFVNSGYKIALDDFGAEYSNIYVLYSLKLSSLKLDRRIVSDIYHDNRARLVVENVIRICKQLDIDCVAEGVETQELMDVLRDMACDVIQGYYLNKPISEEDFSRLYINCG